MRTSGWLWLAIGPIAACGGHKAPTPAADQPIPICVGQTADATITSRTGETPLQLAPSFLDRMPACGKRDATLPADLAIAGGGTVNAKGDCEYANKVACHFHAGTEFVVSGAPRPKAGELHCIVPTAEPKSPHVFGAHFTCKAGTAVSATQDIHAGQACGAGLLPALAGALATCDARCCDDGTLTITADERRAQGKLDVRPDFRMCAQTLELDCGSLAPLTAHTANAPAFGAPIADGM